MKNALIIGIVVVIVIAAGGYIYFNGVKNTAIISGQAGQIEMQQATPKSAAVVTYKDGKFMPNPVTIKVNEMVTFRNEGSDEMWVASAPHPQHTDYPEFDALRGYKTGEDYKFTFEKMGSWKYHNHLNAKAFGVVEVTE